jgi:hypothetical protein
MTVREAQELLRLQSDHPELGFTEAEVTGMLRFTEFKFSDFERWIRGSACPISPVTKEHLYFHHDFFRFLRTAAGYRRVSVRTDYEEVLTHLLTAIVRQHKLKKLDIR